MKPPASLAEQLRRHAEVFQLALQLGLTPRQAEEELERREAHARWQAGQHRLAAKMRGDPPPPKPPPTAPVQWWQKD